MKKGFTLVELMVVIVVISILATIGVVSFTRVQKQARDSKRKSELTAIQTALLAFFTERRAYPDGLSELVPDYISSVPAAPKGATGTNLDYTYVVDSTHFKYALCVDLETAGAGMMLKVDTHNTTGREMPDAPCEIDF
ncbi:type II secretion system GspH family protein [Patescibacteria group bacterium]|nr:type II secretion system GspH family protein [Patescibacteria group bacterium]